MIRLPGSDAPPFVAAANTPRFPGTWHVNLQSRERALLLLFLLCDVGADDAPTRTRVGAHLDIPPILRAAGEAGMWNEEVGRHFPPLLNLERADGAYSPVEIAVRRGLGLA